MARAPTSKKSRRRLRPRWSSGSGDSNGVMVMSRRDSVSAPVGAAIVETGLDWFSLDVLKE